MKAEIVKHLWENLPDGAYEDDEIGLKAAAVYAHIFMTAGAGGAQVYH